VRGAITTAHSTAIEDTLYRYQRQGAAWLPESAVRCGCGALGVVRFDQDRLVVVVGHLQRHALSGDSDQNVVLAAHLPAPMRATPTSTAITASAIPVTATAKTATIENLQSIV
jgi:hypothetical protein